MYPRRGGRGLDVSLGRGHASLPIPNHNGVPRTSDLNDNFPSNDAARMVDLNTSSSVKGPFYQYCENGRDLR